MSTSIPFDRKNQQIIKNYDICKPQERLNSLYPNIIRSIICGPSNCGKTNLLLNIIPKIYHSNIIICSKTSSQEKYELLKLLVDNVNKKSETKRLFQCLQIDLLPNPEEIQKNSIIIFDDISTENQNKIANYFAYGRHNNISCFYLCQTYSKIPKQLIRDNTNYIILFKQDNTNLKHIHEDYVTDMKYDQFKNICNDSWKEKYGFLVIDTESEKYKYKKMLLGYYDDSNCV